MSAPLIILASLPSFCQKSSKLVEIWQSSDKYKFAHFLRHGVGIGSNFVKTLIFTGQDTIDGRYCKQWRSSIIPA